MIKVLLIAYACEPNKGSEPGVGWNWAIHLSKYVHVTVITRANNIKYIEQELEKNTYPNLEFIFFDLPEIFLKLKKTLGVWFYYFMWQIGVWVYYKKNIKNKKKFDLVHHVTFMSNKFNIAPSLGLPNIIGPVGGLELIPLKFIFFTGRPFKELLRNLMIIRYKYSPLYNFYLNRIDRIILTSNHNIKRVCKKHRNKILVMQIGSNDFKQNTSVTSKNISKDYLKLYWGGILERWKGLEFLLLALKDLPVNYQLLITGRGSDENYFKALSSKLDLKNVFFKGWVDIKELDEIKNNTDIFIFTSLRETTGSILLEMMGRGKASIVLDIGGPSEIADANTSVKIKVSNKQHIVKEMQEAIKTLSINTNLRLKLGLNAYKKIENLYNWDQKARRMVEIYQEVLNENTADS
jgi:glycosyltransferase involved in cell wall biosynthesis